MCLFLRLSFQTTSEEDFQNSLIFYEDLLDRVRDELGPALHDLLCRLLHEEPFEYLLSHAYWSDRVNEDPRTSVDLVQHKNDIVEALGPLRKAAWNALPKHVSDRFIQEAKHFGKVEF